MRLRAARLERDGALAGDGPDTGREQSRSHSGSPTAAASRVGRRRIGPGAEQPDGVASCGASQRRAWCPACCRGSPYTTRATFRLPARIESTVPSESFSKVIERCVAASPIARNSALPTTLRYAGDVHLPVLEEAESLSFISRIRRTERSSRVARDPARLRRPAPWRRSPCQGRWASAAGRSRRGRPGSAPPRDRLP